MAFCKYCGKEIAEGAICSCPGAIHEANANNSFPKADTMPAESEPVNAESKPASSKPAYEGPSIRKVDTGINDRKPAADDGLKKFAALVGAVLFVFIIIVGNMASGSGYKGTVRKYSFDGKTCACFQYIDEEQSCHNHFHLKCLNCGKLIHLNCDHLAEISSHIAEHHGFLIDSSQTVFYGVCAECRGAAPAEDGCD